MMKADCDVLIVGGGMVGLSAALALSRSGLSVVVVEQQDLNRLAELHSVVDSPRAEDFFTRVSAISPANRKWLNSLQVWQELPAKRVSNYDRMVVWDGAGSGEIQFDAADIAEPILGSIVENQLLQSAIYQNLKACSNVTIYAGETIVTINRDSHCVEVELSDHQRISTRLLVGADGGQSKVRQLLGVHFSRIEYGQTAYVATVETTLSHQRTAWQRFTSRGPLAFLPLSAPNLCSIVWSLNNADAAVLANATPLVIEQQLERAFASRLGAVTLKSSWQGFPLTKGHAQTYLADRCVLIGDAAHTIHPLAGQGVNLGFQDVIGLVNRINYLQQKGRDFASDANLAPFARQRKALNRMTQEAMSGFKLAFEIQTPAGIMMRNWGLNQLNRSNWLKNWIAGEAMGLS